MRGLELSRAFYEESVAPMLTRDFPLLPVAAGLVGHGSECFGFDDAVSTDHDFAPSCCLWVTDDIPETVVFQLERAYAKLPKELYGVKESRKSALGSDGRGVFRIGNFYRRYTGCPGAPERWQDWLSTPEEYLAEATNGAVFTDPTGVFSAVRANILEGMPEDVRRKKMAVCAVFAAQSGQYNYSRCLLHGEEGAAMLALTEFVRNACGLMFLLCKVHMPYAKWMLRALRDLPRFSSLEPSLTYLLTAENDDSGKQVKREMVEDICALLIQVLREQGLSRSGSDFLEPHAFSILEGIRDGEIRNLHVMDG